MQLVYAPCNVYRWCVNKGLLPENSLLVFGEISNKTIETQTEIDDCEETRIIVDIAADEVRQTFQVFAGVAVYNLLASESVSGADIQKMANERARLYLEQWLGDTMEPEAESCSALSDDVIHPLVVMLRIFEEKQLLANNTIVMLGSIEENEALIGLVDEKTLHVVNGDVSTQLQQLLEVLSPEQKADLVVDFNAKWEACRAKHAGEYIVLSDLSQIYWDRYIVRGICTSSRVNFPSCFELVFTKCRQQGYVENWHKPCFYF